MSVRRERGQLAEKLAADALRARGYQILETNFRCPLGEIDIVAQDGDDLVFVEVRSRAGRSASLPEESIGPRKRDHIRRAAESYLMLHSDREFRCRVDVVAVDLGAAGSPPRIEVIVNAVTW